MLRTSAAILVSAFIHAGRAVTAAAAAVLLTACGQTGALYLPTEPAAAQRATLPQALWPVMPERKRPDAASAPAATASEPQRPAAPAAPEPAR